MFSRAVIAAVVAACVAQSGQTPPDQKVCRISGHVHRSDNGEPLAKVAVVLYPQDTATASAGTRRVVRSDDDGAFVFSDVPPGTWAIEASRQGFVFRYDRSGSHFLLHAGDVRSDLELTLIPAGVISGVVVDPDGEPVEHLPVMCLRVAWRPGGIRELTAGMWVLTDDQGRFRLYDLSPGLYYVRAGSGHPPAMTSPPLKEGPRGAMQYADAWYPENALAEDAEPLRIGPGTDAENLRIPVRPEQALTITGRVLGEAKALKPSEIVCTKSLPVTMMFGQSGAELQPDGSFTIDGLSPGDYVLSAQTTVNGSISFLGYAQAHLSDANVRVNIQLGTAAEVRGHIALAESDNALPAGLKVYLRSRSSIAIYPASPDAGGRFDVSDVPPGEYTFDLMGDAGRLYLGEARCGGTDYATASLTLAPGTLLSNCELTLRADTAVVTGIVQDGDKPQPGIDVVLVPQSHELRRIPRYTRTATTGADGRFTIAGAVPEDYFVFAVPRDTTHEMFALSFPERHARDAVSVRLPPNATTPVTLTLTRD